VRGLKLRRHAKPGEPVRWCPRCTPISTVNGRGLHCSTGGAAGYCAATLTSTAHMKLLGERITEPRQSSAWADGRSPWDRRIAAARASGWVCHRRCCALRAQRHRVARARAKIFRPRLRDHRPRVTAQIMKPATIRIESRPDEPGRVRLSQLLQPSDHGLEAACSRRRIGREEVLALLEVASWGRAADMPRSRASSWSSPIRRLEAEPEATGSAVVVLTRCGAAQPSSTSPTAAGPS